MPRKQHSFLEAVQISATLLFVLFAVKAVEGFAHISLAGFGIVPRTPHGLIGIAFSPLLHGNIMHLLANAVPLFVLLIFLFWDRHYYPKLTLFLIWTASGLGTWLIGRGRSVHIGASSVIFGLVTYLMVAGVLMKSWRSAFVAMFVALCFGGILYGVLPSTGPVSWEGHLCGAIAGVWAAYRNHD